MFSHGNGFLAVPVLREGDAGGVDSGMRSRHRSARSGTTVSWAIRSAAAFASAERLFPLGDVVDCGPGVLAVADTIKVPTLSGRSPTAMVRRRIGQTDSPGAPT